MPKSALELNEEFAIALTDHRIEWCRARLYLALAGAARQGVLDEVLDELTDDDDTVKEKILGNLRSFGWLSPEDRKIP
jgi:hypothetical protein